MLIIAILQGAGHFTLAIAFRTLPLRHHISPQQKNSEQRHNTDTTKGQQHKQKRRQPVPRDLHAQGHGSHREQAVVRTEGHASTRTFQPALDALEELELLAVLLAELDELAVLDVLDDALLVLEALLLEELPVMV
jgi:hypothetical protein